MFGLKKKAEPNYSVDSLKNMFGYLLQNRNDIIPDKLFLDQEMNINPLVGISRSSLNKELDALVIYYARCVYDKNGVSREEQEKAMDELFGELVEDKVFDQKESDRIRDHIEQRMKDYRSQSGYSDAATSFLVSVTNNLDIYRSGQGTDCAPVMKTLNKNLSKIIETDLYGRPR